MSLSTLRFRTEHCIQIRTNKQTNKKTIVQILFPATAHDGDVELAEMIRAF